MQTHDIWVTGVRAEQSRQRETMTEIMPGIYNTTRYHPMLNWTSKMIWEYRKNNNLPTHPLEEQGYLSIGCFPCTTPHIDDERSSRWSGQSKKECGLHTDLIAK